MLKGFFILLYDKRSNRTVASFEVLKEGHLLDRKKCDRQGWVEDSVTNLLFDEECFKIRSTAYERGHLICHGDWNFNKKMVSEMSVMTNAFPQIKGFVGYMDVEQFGRMLSKHTDVLVVTCLVDNCERIVKVFLWTSKNSPGILAFSFPNTQHAFGHLSTDQRKCGGSFITNRSILGQLPFKIGNADAATFLQEAPITEKKWKQRIIKAIRGNV